MPDWLTAIGLVLIIEGVLPFIAPGQWRATMLRIAQMRDGQIRFMGLGALAVGVVFVLL